MLQKYINIEEIETMNIKDKNYYIEKVELVVDATLISMLTIACGVICLMMS